MLGRHAIPGDVVVGALVALVQRILLAAFFRHGGLAMKFLQAHIAGVGNGCGVGMELDVGLLEQPEVMATSRVMSEADNLVRRLVDNELRLQRVALFLA